MKRTDEKEISILVPEDDLQGGEVEALAGTLDQLLSENRLHVALNFNKVNCIYSGGIGLLLRYQKALKAAGGALHIFNVPETVSRIFQETHLTEYLNVFSSREKMDFRIEQRLEEGRGRELAFGLRHTNMDEEAGCLRVKLEGTVDSERDVSILAQVCGRAYVPGIREVMFDLTGLAYMDQSSANLLKETARRLDENGARLILKFPNDIIKDQLEKVGLQNRFEWF